MPVFWNYRDTGRIGQFLFLCSSSPNSDYTQQAFSVFIRPLFLAGPYNQKRVVHLVEDARRDTTQVSYSFFRLGIEIFFVELDKWPFD